ncbi:MAG TPA: MBL fold metallo-hydrolase, partial [Polyangiaceae bacterium]
LDDGEGGKVRVTTAPGNHPDGVWVFRIEHGSKSAVYATDTEHPFGYHEACHTDDVDPHIVAIARDVDVLIYDSQYTPEEYAGAAGVGGPKKGWGHSTFEAGAKLARACGAKKYVLFHHDPGQSDAAVRDKERRARELFPNCLAAFEGLILDV